MSKLAESKPLPGRVRALLFAAVLCLCAAGRAWVIACSRVISADGTAYIRMARLWSQGTSLTQIAHQYQLHLGYPLAIAAMHAVASRFGLAPGVDGWDRCGQTISLIASLAAMAALWIFAERTFNWKIALITTVFLAVARKWAILGEDVLSDSSAVALQMWGILFALWTLDSLPRPGGRTLILAALTGLCAGLGYLVRPEAMLPAALAAALWLLWQIRRKFQWKWTLASLLAMTVTAAASALPYILMIGSFTRKKRLSDLVDRPAGHGLPLAMIGDFSQTVPAAGVLIWRIGEALSFVLWALIFLWLIGWIIKRIAGRELCGIALAEPAAPEIFLMIAALAILSPILIGLQLHLHYLDYRHATFLAILLCPLGGAGQLMLLGATGVLFRRNSRAFRLGIKAALLIAAVVPPLILSLQPIHSDKLYERTAALKLRPLLSPGDYILSDGPRLLHYADSPGEEIAPDPAAILQRVRAAGPPITWVAVHDETGDDLHSPMFTQVIYESDSWFSSPHYMRVFHVNRPAVPQ